ncbi:MAG: hypothetical protein CVU54_16880 [Deltaproteobacteria bacterium HGW-Deltaproteobacteria-12]|jgi:hypothetical protein|nr:MAG: hypothetical protein CVU54_16880 [Deltaproteobacteria bacterium HGW-Deltaproteobacteria-12]
MKRLFLETLLLALVIAAPAPSLARVDVNVHIALPPPIVFAAPPELIVIPDTYVYVAPEIEEDIFFWNGWWWRLWEGRWYRSHYYNRGWGHYSNVPGFYFDVDPGWREYYRDNNWYGHRWRYERIPHRRLQQNWKGWQNDRHWERKGTWGVQSYQPRPQQQRQEMRQQRQKQYHQRPEVQKQRQPQVQQPKPQHREAAPQARKAIQPKQREAINPQHREAAPQSRKGQAEQDRQQRGGHERGKEDKQDRK